MNSAMGSLGALFVLVLAGPAAAQSDTASVASLSWMSGCWVANERGPGMLDSEQWTWPAGSMFGINRSIRDGQVTFYEFLRIEQQRGEIYFVALPEGAERETSFRLTKLGEKKVVFENPEHDFPKRIEYAQPDPDSLHAKVSSGERGFEILFRKVSCDQP